jgi:dolichyl-phosphate-mannose-protein mannosyltransferase
VIWLILAAAGLAATAGLVACALRLESAVSFGLALFLLASAEVIALTEVLSLLGFVRAAGYAAGEAILLAAALAAWHLRGRPRPPVRRLELGAAVRAHPLVAALALVVGCAVGYEAVLVFWTPPNNWDSMSYHLSRAAAWYQRQRVEYIPTRNERQNAFQPNSEMEILYTFSFVGSDTAAAATQLLAELALLLGVYGCARRLGSTRAASLLAALLTATLTEIAVQSVTTQNDLLAASFVVAAACLALGQSRAELALAGVAAGLALGTKLTSAPGLALVAALTLARPPRDGCKRRRQSRRRAAGKPGRLRRPWERLAVLAAASALAFVAVGFYGYGLNLIETGTPLGDPSAQGDTTPDVVTFGGTVSTVARIGFRFFDFSGMNPPGWLTSFVSDRGRNVFDLLGIDPDPSAATQTHFDFRTNSRVNEDVSWFGPLGFLLVLPLAAGFLVAGGLRRAHPAAAALAAAVPVYAIALALGFRYNLWLGRFMITPVALTMPLAAVVYRSRPVAAAFAVVGVLGLYDAHVKNETKPSGRDERPAALTLRRAEAQTILRPDMLEVIDAVERFVPATAQLGTVLSFDDWDYPLYSSRLTRRVVVLPPGNVLAVAEGRHIDSVLLDRDAARPPPRATWTRIDFHESRWTLYLRLESSANPRPAGSARSARSAPPRAAPSARGSGRPAPRAPDVRGRRSRRGGASSGRARRRPARARASFAAPPHPPWPAWPRWRSRPSDGP